MHLAINKNSKVMFPYLSQMGFYVHTKKNFKTVKHSTCFCLLEYLENILYIKKFIPFLNYSRIYMFTTPSLTINSGYCNTLIYFNE